MKFLFLFTPAGSFLASVVVVQQSGITISAELLITLLTNVALIALAWGSLKNRVDNLAEQIHQINDPEKGKASNPDLAHLEEIIDLRMKTMEERVEGVAKRYHNIANIIMGSKMISKMEEGDGDKN